MEEWERRYVHERDVRDAQLKSRGLPPITGEQYGTLKAEPKNLWMKFDGRTFWPALKEKGHTSVVYEDCECRQRNG